MLIYRAKYPLAILAKALDMLPNGSVGGQDIACGFEITARNSSLSSKITEKHFKFIVNAFHGYSHNFQCQIKNHPRVSDGVGLEDFETMERVFSMSNSLTSITRYASPYRRRIFIDFYLRQWDEDKDLNLASFILNNYVQALNILDEDVRLLEEAKVTLDFSDADMDRWEVEQREFFASLGKEPESYSLKVEYVELLQSLQVAANVRGSTTSSLYGHIEASSFVTETLSSVQTGYSKATSVTMRLETNCHLARERYENTLTDIVEMEVRLGIGRRWVPGDLEYIETLKYMTERKYHQAADKVHQLVIQRLFELQKLNIAGTGKHLTLFPLQLFTSSLGYKMRTLLAKSLQTRSKAIRRAVSELNTAATAPQPPREHIDWLEISPYGFIEQFVMLKNTRNDIRDRPWAKPLYHEALKL